MTGEREDNLLVDLFRVFAFAAYVELAIAFGGVPDSEATRRLAYRYYEEEIAAIRHRRKTAGTE